MPQYESDVPLPERFGEFMQLLSEQGVPSDLSYNENRGRWQVKLSYQAADLWEAARDINGIELDDRYSHAWEGETVEFIDKPREVEPARITPDELEANRQNLVKHGGFGGTERVYLTAEAAQAARVDEELEALERSTRGYLASDDENLRDHTEHNRVRLAATLDLPADPALTQGTRADEPRNQEWIRRDIRAAIESGALPVQIGDPATVHVGSDRYPYTVRDVVAFKSGPRKGQPRKISATTDNARYDQAAGKYTYLPVDTRTPTEFLATDTLGLFKSRANTILRVGRRDYYQAPEV